LNGLATLPIRNRFSIPRGFRLPVDSNRQPTRPSILLLEAVLPDSSTARFSEFFVKRGPIRLGARYQFPITHSKIVYGLNVSTAWRVRQPAQPCYRRHRVPLILREIRLESVIKTRDFCGCVSSLAREANSKSYPNSLFADTSPTCHVPPTLHISILQTSFGVLTHPAASIVKSWFIVSLANHVRRFTKAIEAIKLLSGLIA